MLLMTEVLPERFAEPLLRHNIRFVEQFLSMMLEPDATHALAKALDCTVEDLEAVALKVQDEHPDLIVPKYSGREYGLGYGKKTDWKCFSR